MMLPAVPPRQDEADPPLLVGRERELRLLRGHLAASLAGRGRLVLVGGSAGIGKTTLVAAVAREAAAQGVLVLGGACYDLTATPPYGPWRDLAAGYRPAAGMPHIPAVLTDDEPTAVGGPGALFAQVRGFLAALAAVRPVLVVLEDLHWADPASLDLLRVVGRHLAAIPLLVIGTYRADEVTRDTPLYRVLPVLVREAQADRLDLQRLDETGVRALVAARYSLPEVDIARLAAYLQGNADGNPFFAHEILRTLEAEAVLRPLGEGWVLGDIGRVGVPPLLRQVIDDRVARLGDEMRERLAVAAVIGQEVPLDLWGAIGGVAEEDLLTTVERAIEAHLLEASGEGSRVRFVHALVREALYEGILPMRRRGWHRRVGELLATRTKSDPEAVAHHFGQAGDERAVPWLMRAGERAQRAYAWRNAAERFAAAAARLEGDATRAGERGWLLYRVGRLLRYADPAQGIAYLEEAGRVAAAVEDAVLAAYALVDQGMLRCFVKDIRRGLAEMIAGTDALDALPAASIHAGGDVAAWVADALPEPTHARVGGGNRPPATAVNLRRGALVVWLANAGRYAEAEAMGTSQLAEMGEMVRPDEAVLSSIGDIHLGLAQVASALGRPDAASEAFVRARIAHRAIDHHILLAADAKLELDGLHLVYRTTHLTERRRLRAEVEAALTRMGGAMAIGGSLEHLDTGYLLNLRLLEGVWTDIEPFVDAARASVQNWQVVVGSVGWQARHQGMPVLAWGLVREELPDGPATEPGGSQYLSAVALLRVAAELALDEDDLSTARAWLEAHDRWLAWSGAVPGQVEGHLLWARYHHIGGETAQARQCAERALQRATEPRQPLALVQAHRRLGEIETAAGHAVEAATHLDEALALADACAAPYERALTLLALAELRASTGGTGEASVALDEVRTICVPLHAALTVARADALVSRLVPATPVGDHPAGLSAREVEVLRLVAEGLTDAEVADRLSISPRTVGQHLRSVYNKLGVPSRAAATRFAVEHDLV